MSRILRLRKVSEEEAEQIRKLATSRTQPARLVQRSRIIQLMLENPKLPAEEAGRLAGYKSKAAGRRWVKRFNESGIKGLGDESRPGPPLTHSEAVRSSLISLALQKPSSLGYPFELWTLERLQRAFEEREGIHLSDSTIWKWLDAEGLKWKRQQSWFHEAEKHDPEFAEKRSSVIFAYVAPPPLTRVICIDEMGPVSAKTYPGETWEPGPYRAKFEPDYGRRGKIWVHGAFEPATGDGILLFSPSRDSASHIQLLEHVIECFPSDRWLIVEDNLGIHTSRDVRIALLAWPEIQIQFIPKYACWLNLIEPWWKQLRSLALKGRRFENTDEIIQAFIDALDYWRTYRHPYQWKKKPEEQPLITLGGFGSSWESKTHII